MVEVAAEEEADDLLHAGSPDSGSESSGWVEESAEEDASVVDGGVADSGPVGGDTPRHGSHAALLWGTLSVRPALPAPLLVPRTTVCVLAVQCASCTGSDSGDTTCHPARPAR